MCGGCNTSSTTIAANPEAQAAYNDVIGKAQTVANTPYQPYTGQLVAGLNKGQNQAIGQLAGSYGASQPYIAQGDSFLAKGDQGLGNVQNYLQAGSDATANVAGYQGLAGNSFNQATTYGQQSAAALQGMQPYMQQASGSLGLAGNSFGQAGGSLGLAGNSFGQAGGALGQAGNSFAQATGALGQAGSSFAQATGALGQAGNYFGKAAGYADPVQFSGQALQQYMNPYTQSVIDTTMAQAHQNDQVQATNLAGGAIGSGAFGGDRNGVAQAALAGQQSMANNQTVAGLNSANYSQAVGQFNQEQADRYQAAGVYTGLGQGSIAQAAGYNTTGQGYLGQAAGYDTTGQGYLGQASGFNTQGQGYLGQASGYDTQGQGYLGQASGYSNQATQQGQIAQQLGNLGSLANSTGSGYNASGQLGLGMGSNFNSLGSLQGTTGQAYGALAGQSGSLGQANQATQIAGASAGLQGSTLAQQNQQQQDTALYNQYMAGLSYPYQQVGFLSNIVQGIGSQEGNTTTTQGNLLSSIGGLGVTGLGILGGTGAFGTNGYLTGKTGAAHGGAIRAPQRGLGSVPHRAAGGPVGMGLGAAPQMNGLGGLPGLGAAPQGAGLSPFAGRPRFLSGGDVSDEAPIPTGGLDMSPAGLMGNGLGFSTSPGGLTAPTAAMPMPKGLGAGRPLQAANAPAQGQAGLGVLGAAPMSGSDGAGLGSTQSPSSSGFSPGAASGEDSAKSGSGGGLGGVSQNAWLGIMAAGLGMMGGTSASAAANIGQGGLEGLKMWQGLNQQDRQAGYQQAELGLKQQGMKIDQQRADQDAQRLMQQFDIDRQRVKLDTGRLANDTSNTASEIAARDQQTQAARYQTTLIPGVGTAVRDTTRPYDSPRIIQYDPQPGSTDTPAAATPPQVAAAPPPAARPTSPPITGTGPIAPARSGSSGIVTVPPTGAQPASQPLPPPAAPAPSWTATTTVPRGYVPPNQAAIYMNPGQLKGEQEIATKNLEDVRGQAQSASQVQFRLDEMNHAVADMPKSGILSQGSFANERSSFAKAINGISQAAGGAPVFPESQVAAFELTAKDRFRLGAELSKSIGGREPGFIVAQAIAANPGADNTAAGYKRITAGLQAGAQYAQDKAAFFNDFSAKYGHLNGAQELFTKLNPPQAYVNNAIVSTVDPRDIEALRSNAKNPEATKAIDGKYGVGVSKLLMGR